MSPSFHALAGVAGGNIVVDLFVHPWPIEILLQSCVSLVGSKMTRIARTSWFSPINFSRSFPVVWYC